jgi:hypothetical protein
MSLGNTLPSVMTTMRFMCLLECAKFGDITFAIAFRLDARVSAR